MSAFELIGPAFLFGGLVAFVFWLMADLWRQRTPPGGK